MAPRLTQRAVNFVDVPASSLGVKAVDVLRDDAVKFALTLELGEGQVPRVGRHAVQQPEPVPVKLIEKQRPLEQGVDAGQLFRPVLAPEPVLGPEVRQSGLRAP